MFRDAYRNTRPSCMTVFFTTLRSSRNVSGPLYKIHPFRFAAAKTNFRLLRNFVVACWKARPSCAANALTLGVTAAKTMCSSPRWRRVVYCKALPYCVTAARTISGSVCNQYEFLQPLSLSHNQRGWNGNNALFTHSLILLVPRIWHKWLT